MKTTTTGRAVVFIASVIIATGCGPNQRILQSANENAAVVTDQMAPNSNRTPVGTGFEQDLNAMRTADFKFIIVFRRKDGQALTSQDKSLIGTNTGMQANRRRVSDEGRAVIIAGNFPFATKPMRVLTEKFKMEDYSKPDSGPLTSDALDPDSSPGDLLRVEPNKP